MIYNGADRREWPRVDVRLPIRFREVGEFGSSPIDSETQDVSEGGIKFNSGKFLPKNSKLVLNMNLTDVNGMKATVKVVWSARDSHTSMYETGVEFDNIPSEARGQLSHFVRGNLNNL
ncbi:MAG: PilZ domain-containing protein [Candidatus Saelkia tenebricola]|nr:PilZ domain-containing protein [Candidatus Saelkia tenebricola]